MLPSLILYFLQTRSELTCSFVTCQVECFLKVKRNISHRSVTAFLRISPDASLLGATFFATFDLCMVATPLFVNRLSGSSQKKAQHKNQVSLTLIANAAAALKRVAPPEVRDPTGQTLDP